MNPKQVPREKLIKSEDDRYFKAGKCEVQRKDSTLSYTFHSYCILTNNLFRKNLTIFMLIHALKLLLFGCKYCRDSRQMQL